MAMRDTDKPRNLWGKIASVMADLEPIAKDGKVAFGSTKYGYVRAEILFATLQKKLAGVGLVVLPAIHDVTSTPGDSKTVLAKMSFRIVDVDSGESVETPWYGQAPATDDKAVSKAGTSAEKYFLMKLFLISDAEDPDADSRTSDEHQQQDERRRQPVIVVPTDPTTLRADITTMLHFDPDAAGKLPKGVEDMTEDELKKAHAWLQRRQLAQREGRGA